VGELDQINDDFKSFAPEIDYSAGICANPRTGIIRRITEAEMLREVVNSVGKKGHWVPIFGA